MKLLCNKKPLLAFVTVFVVKVLEFKFGAVVLLFMKLQTYCYTFISLSILMTILFYLIW